MPRLQDRIAVVSGASRGGGRGIALVLGSEGATVYVTGRSIRGDSTRPALPGTTIDDTAEQVTARGGHGIPVRCDHTVQADIQALFGRVRKEHGHLDLLVNNAWGGYEPGDGVFDAPFWELSLARWDKMLRAGVWSTFVTSYFAAPLLLAAPGSLVVDTLWDWDGYGGGNLAYYTAKKAIHHLTTGMAVEFRPQGVAVVGLVPGWMRTEGVMAGIPPNSRPEGDQIEQTESTEYIGRAVAALAADPHLMDKTGRILHTRDLGREYGFTDIDGRDPPFYEGCAGWQPG